MPNLTVDAIGFCGLEYEQVIVFRRAESFQQALEANPHMVPIVGALDAQQDTFPGVYIAGIKAREPSERSAGHPAATQK